jgi:hypothetical protein
LSGLVLHERDQRGDDDRGSFGNYCGQLVAERFASAGGHDDAGVASGEESADYALLERAEGVVSPVAAQRSEQVSLGEHERTV